MILLCVYDTHLTFFVLISTRYSFHLVSKPILLHLNPLVQSRDPPATPLDPDTYDAQVWLSRRRVTTEKYVTFGHFYLFTMTFTLDSSIFLPFCSFFRPVWSNCEASCPPISEPSLICPILSECEGSKFLTLTFSSFFYGHEAQFRHRHDSIHKLAITSVALKVH